MTYTVTYRDLDRSDFNRWRTSPSRTVNNNQLINTVPEGTIEIMITGPEGWCNYERRHTTMRYNNKYISFYPIQKNLCLSPGSFHSPGDDGNLQPPFIHFTIRSEDNDINITNTLNTFFSIEPEDEDQNSTAWQIPDISKDNWQFKCCILVICGIGCCIRKANCTSIVVNALSRIGLTTDLNVNPSVYRTAQDTVTILSLLYLITQTIKYAVSDDNIDMVAPVIGGVELLAFSVYLFMVYCQPHVDRNTNNPLEIPSDRERNENCNAIFKYCCTFQSDLQKFTNASRALMLMTVSLVILDISIDVAFGRRPDIIPSNKDGILISDVRLTAIFMIGIFATRVSLLTKALFTDFQNGPQNPIELAYLLKRVAAKEIDLENGQGQNPIADALNIGQVQMQP